MSTTVWSMAIGGGSGAALAQQAASLTALGVENPHCVFRSLADDEFTFEIKQSATAALLLVYGETVTLYKNVGGVQTIWFVGTVTGIEVVGSARIETVRYRCSNVWFQLKTTMWQAASQCYLPSLHTCALVSQNMTKVVLFQDPVTGLSITTGQQIANAITYARTLALLVTAGTLPAFVNVPFEETRDLTIADVIRRALQWSPNAVTWFNYSTGQSVLSAGPASGLSGVTLNLAADNLVTEFHLTPRSDLVPKGVIFNYIGISTCNVVVPNNCVDPSTGILNTSGNPVVSQHPIQIQTITQDVAGTVTGGQVLIGSIDLTQLTGTTTENPPTGLAAAYYASLLNVIWQGSITTHEYECSGTLRPGNALNLSNGQTAWATMATPMQEVTEDLYTGVTTAKFGMPEHLAPQTFAYLVNMTARRPLVVSGLAAVNTPGTGGANCPQGISPAAQKLINLMNGSSSAVAAAVQNSALFNANICEINVCNGGNLTVLKLYCPPQ